MRQGEETIGHLSHIPPSHLNHYMGYLYVRIRGRPSHYVPKSQHKRLPSPLPQRPCSLNLALLDFHNTQQKVPQLIAFQYVAFVINMATTSPSLTPDDAHMAR